MRREGLPVRRRHRHRRADTIEQAKAAAAEKVKVDLEVLPAYMSAPAAMAEDAIEIHPGTPNVYFEQKIVKGHDTAPIMEQRGLHRRGRLLPAAPAAPHHRERRRLRLLRRGGPADHPLQEHRPLPAPRHDRPRPRHRAREAAHGPEPGRRHLRLQVLARPWRPCSASPPWPPGARSTWSTTTSSHITYTGKRSPFCHERQAGGRQGRQARRHGVATGRSTTAPTPSSVTC